MLFHYRYREEELGTVPNDVTDLDYPPIEASSYLGCGLGIGAGHGRMGMRGQADWFVKQDCVWLGIGGAFL